MKRFLVITALALAAAATGCSTSSSGKPMPTRALNGGSFTWSSGATMTLKVVRVEPWGRTTDYCGDGSCGVSHPDDLRWVLQYTITVPTSAAVTVDPLRCPGTLRAGGGGDADLIIGVAGEYARRIDGKITAGATKTGAEEYSIDKSLLGKTFTLTSTCGDPAHHESIAFTGTINRK